LLLADDGNYQAIAAIRKEADCLIAGVKSYSVSLDDQTATVIAEPSLEYETVLKTIAKTGKRVNSGSADGEARPVDLE
jgi:copper chaperone